MYWPHVRDLVAPSGAVADQQITVPKATKNFWAFAELAHANMAPFSKPGFGFQEI